MKTIVVDTLNNPSIELDGDTASVTAGGYTHQGSFTVRNKEGKPIGSLVAEDGGARLQLNDVPPNNVPAINLVGGSQADVHVGNGSGAGNIFVYPGKSWIPSVALDGGTGGITAGGSGKEGSLTINNQAGKAMVSVRSGPGQRAGEVVLFNEAGSKTLELFGGTDSVQGATINAYDEAGKGVFGISSTQNGTFASIGGVGKNGSLICWNSDYKAAALLGCPTGRSFGRVALSNELHRIVATLSGGGSSDNDIYGHGTLTLSDRDGKAMISLDGGNADIFAGGNGQAGKVVLRDKQGKDTLILDGATGDVILTNADCAEFFDISGTLAEAPGTVMVIHEDGRLIECSRAYDKKVAGVVSGAGEYRPGIVLDNDASRANRLPIGLLGKVYCKVDAQYGAIEVGDLLTTSPTPGHAMKATDAQQSFGAVLGKALRPLRSGQGMIPILIALH